MVSFEQRNQHSQLSVIDFRSFGFKMTQNILYFSWTFPIIIILALVLVRYQTPKFDLVIVVLSSREHFIQRSTIRETWKNVSIFSKSVKTVFVVGDECLVHPDDRRERYSCNPWNISTADIDGDEFHSWINVQGEDQVDTTASTEFKFDVLHPILITDLTVQTRCLVGIDSDTVSLTLYNRATDEAVTYVDISNDTINESTPMTSFKLPYPDLLLKGFEGVIILEGVRCPNLMYLGGKCSSFLNCVGVRTAPTVGMNFRLSDKDMLRGHINSRPTRHDDWLRLQAQQIDRVAEEAALYGDILRVNTVDVYRNLPDKLLLAIKWVSNSLDTKYIMKTDDDCYVNIPQVLNKLEQLTKDNISSGIWLGNFRKLWAVYDHGKWAEHTYTGLAYPWFACGSGYIISSDVGAYLATAYPHLHKFQGEDVSMGIWLSPLSIRHVEDGSFSCVLPHNTSSMTFTSIPQMTPEEIKAYHNALMSTHSL